jgi:hypothetical protein
MLLAPKVSDTAETKVANRYLLPCYILSGGLLNFGRHLNFTAYIRQALHLHGVHQQHSLWRMILEAYVAMIVLVFDRRTVFQRCT